MNDDEEIEDYYDNDSLWEDESVWSEDEELWNADPDCKHNIVCASGGGIKCTKCSGWFCF